MKRRASRISPGAPAGIGLDVFPDPGAVGVPVGIPNRVLGTGTYGCVIWPALLFYNSVEVTPENTALFVTKVARDAIYEYDLAMEIKSRVRPSVGVFPVDQLTCGISYKDIAPFYSQASRNCKVQLGKQFFEQSEALIAAKKPKRLFEGKLRGGEKHLCAIQYPKYDRDLADFSELPKTQQKVDLFVKFKRELKEKLLELHENNIVHLDIKPQNLCQMQDEAFLCDWGFAFIMDTHDDVRKCIEFLMSQTMVEYYVKLVPHDRYTIAQTYREAILSYFTSIAACVQAHFGASAEAQEHLLKEMTEIVEDLDACLLSAALRRISYTLR